MIKNGGGLIDVTLCDGFLYCALVFSKSIAIVMPYTFLLIISKESVRRGSFFNKTACFSPPVTTERSRCQGGGGGLRCLALTSMPRRLLHRRYDMRGGEGKAAWQHCEEQRILRLLEMT